MSMTTKRRPIKFKPITLIPYPNVEDDIVLNFIMTWAGDDDKYDTYINLKETYGLEDDSLYKEIRLNYRFINELLLNYNYNIRCIQDITRMCMQDDETSKSYIQGLIRYAIQKDENKIFFKKIFKIYLKLINTLYNEYSRNFKTLETYYRENSHIEKPNNFVVYRGFNYTAYKLLVDKTLELNIGDTFNTGCFLSSSVSSGTALRFINKNDENPKIMWVIVVPTHKFSNFYYAYITRSKQVEIIRDIRTKTNKEYEVLLNMNMKLILKNIIPDNYDSDYNITYTKYVWEFVDYELLEPNYFIGVNTFLNQVYDLIDIKQKSYTQRPLTLGQIKKIQTIQSFHKKINEYKRPLKLKSIITKAK